MELSRKDKVENTIQVMIVVPKSNKFYHYFINGLPDCRSMRQKAMIDFCITLCPKYAQEIRESILQLVPFIIYPEQNVFEPLKEKAPPPINRRAVLFPMGKLVKNDKIDESKTDNFMVGLGKQFNIWDKYGIHVESIKKDSKKPFIPNIFNLK